MNNCSLNSLQQHYSKIDPSKLAAGVVLQARILCRSRRETAFSPESMGGSSEAKFSGEPQIVGGVLELADVEG